MSKISYLFKYLGVLSFSFLFLFSFFANFTSVNAETPAPAVSPTSDKANPPTSANKGLISQMNLTSYSCIFPSKGGACENGGEALISSVTSWLVGLGSSIAVLVIVWGGYRYFIGTLTDDKEQGKTTIRAGVIGLMFVLGANAITKMIEGSFDTNGSLSLSNAGIVGFIKTLLSAAIPLAAAVAVAFLVYGGYLITTSGGDSEKEKSGQNAIKNSVIGLVVVLLAASIVQVITLATKAGGLS